MTEAVWARNVRVIVMHERHALSPVVFVHGLWLHASCWQPWIGAFRQAGYEASAPGWPGEMSTVAETRSHPGAIVDANFDDLVRYYAAVLVGMTPSPVLIGHAFGGRLVHRLVELGLAGGGISIDAENGSTTIGTAQLDAAEFASFYGSAITSEESDLLFDRWAIPAARGAVVDAGSVVTAAAPAAVRVPFLVILGGPAGDADPAVDAPFSNGTDLRRFSDRGRSLTIDSGWLEIAESCLAWLDAQEL
jgi:pimeloyl-ACP methyl ester carboxylesterase